MPKLCPKIMQVRVQERQPFVCQREANDVISWGFPHRADVTSVLSRQSKFYPSVFQGPAPSQGVHSD